MRRTLLVWLALALCLTGPTRSQAAAGSPLVAGVDAVGTTVADMDRSVAFYTQVLTFQKVSDVEVAGAPYEHLEGVFALRMRVVRLRLGDETLELTQFLTPRGRPMPLDSHSDDLWFQHVAIIVSDMGRAYAWLRARHAEYVSPEPQRLPDWNKEAGGIEAFYFHDPDAHTLEILHFPPGKGDPKWRRPTARLFLGIDHSAVAVADTDASLRYYRDTLGLKVTGESLNYGPEQERLNAVFGARLRITSLRAASGPGVELLEYLAPRGGRPIPADTRPDDLIYWHLILRTERIGDAPGGPAGVTALPDGALGFRRALTARDPDGHADEFITP